MPEFKHLTTSLTLALAAASASLLWAQVGQAEESAPVQTKHKTTTEDELTAEQKPTSEGKLTSAQKPSAEDKLTAAQKPTSEDKSTSAQNPSSVDKTTKPTSRIPSEFSVQASAQASSKAKAQAHPHTRVLLASTTSRPLNLEQATQQLSNDYYSRFDSQALAADLNFNYYHTFTSQNYDDFKSASIRQFILENMPRSDGKVYNYSQEPVRILADRLEVEHAGRKIRYSGNVVMTQGDRVLKTPELIYYQFADGTQIVEVPDKVELKSNVIIFEARQLFTHLNNGACGLHAAPASPSSTTAQHNQAATPSTPQTKPATDAGKQNDFAAELAAQACATKGATIAQADFSFVDTIFVGNAHSINWHGQTIDFSDIAIHAGPPGRLTLNLKASSGKVDLDKSVIKLRNNLVRIGSVPVFWLPSYSIRLDGLPVSQFLEPQLSLNHTRELSVSLPYFLYINRFLEGTFTGHYATANGLSFESDVRGLSSLGTTRIHGYYVSKYLNNKLFGKAQTQDRYYFGINHVGTYGINTFGAMEAWEAIAYRDALEDLRFRKTLDEEKNPRIRRNFLGFLGFGRNYDLLRQQANQPRIALGTGLEPTIGVSHTRNRFLTQMVDAGSGLSLNTGYVGRNLAYTGAYKGAYDGLTRGLPYTNGADAITYEGFYASLNSAASPYSRANYQAAGLFSTDKADSQALRQHPAGNQPTSAAKNQAGNQGNRQANNQANQSKPTRTSAKLGASQLATLASQPATRSFKDFINGLFNPFIGSTHGRYRAVVNYQLVSDKQFIYDYWNGRTDEYLDNEFGLYYQAPNFDWSIRRFHFTPIYLTTKEPFAIGEANLRWLTSFAYFKPLWSTQVSLTKFTQPGTNGVVETGAPGQASQAQAIAAANAATAGTPVGTRASANEIALNPAVTIPPLTYSGTGVANAEGQPAQEFYNNSIRFYWFNKLGYHIQNKYFLASAEVGLHSLLYRQQVPVLVNAAGNAIDFYGNEIAALKTKSFFASIVQEPEQAGTSSALDAGSGIATGTSSGTATGTASATASSLAATTSSTPSSTRTTNVPYAPRQPSAAEIATWRWQKQQRTDFFTIPQLVLKAVTKLESDKPVFGRYRQAVQFKSGLTLRKRLGNGQFFNYDSSRLQPSLLNQSVNDSSLDRLNDTSLLQFGASSSFQDVRSGREVFKASLDLVQSLSKSIDQHICTASYPYTRAELTAALNQLSGQPSTSGTNSNASASTNASAFAADSALHNSCTLTYQRPESSLKDSLNFAAIKASLENLEVTTSPRAFDLVGQLHWNFGEKFNLDASGIIDLSTRRSSMAIVSFNYQPSLGKVAQLSYRHVSKQYLLDNNLGAKKPISQVGAAVLWDVTPRFSVLASSYYDLVDKAIVDSTLAVNYVHYGWSVGARFERRRGIEAGEVKYENSYAFTINLLGFSSYNNKFSRYIDSGAIPFVGNR